MSRVFFLLLFLFISNTVFSQTTEQKARSVTYAFQVVAGKTYSVSASPAGNEDAVVAIGLDPAKPMLIVNSNGDGIGESYKVQASSDKMQVAVFLNSPEAKHTLAVIDEDQKFPYLLWRQDSKVVLETTSDGYISAFKFSWLHHIPYISRASAKVSQPQTIAADSAVSYRFNVRPGMPLDIILVPETNHLDLALFVVNKGISEPSDNNRSIKNIRLTKRGQVEWTQTTPLESEIEVIVAEKSGLGGNYRMSVRPLNGTGKALSPIKWDYLSPAMTEQRFVDLFSQYPMINHTESAVYEFLPIRTVNNYTFEATSVDTGLDFSLVVRADRKSPPIVIRAGGGSKRTASFSWSYRDGKLLVANANSGETYRFEGFPTRAKLQISVLNTNGSGRIKGSLTETHTLRDLKLPKARIEPAETVRKAMSAAYEGFADINNDLVLYRFESIKGKSYKIEISPIAFFDTAIVDPSVRNFDQPTALELTDKNGTGAKEVLSITAKEDFIEFGVIGIRYVNGIVKSDNKRIGGEGFYRLQVKDAEGNTPILKESVRVELPNDVVSKELGLTHQPTDPVDVLTASKLPPYPSEIDKKITHAMNPL